MERDEEVAMAQSGEVERWIEGAVGSPPRELQPSGSQKSMIPPIVRSV